MKLAPFKRISLAKLTGVAKTTLLVGCAIALVACHGAKNRDQSAINDANAAYNDNGQAGQAQTNGLGQEVGYGDEASGGGPRSHLAGRGQHLSKRIYYFDFDRSDVRDDDRPAIDANADYLLAHPGARVIIEGHTDPRGSREYNVGLGERRAKAVASIIRAKGVRPEQIRIVSYGAEKLASPGRSESDYQMDRRVVLVYMQR